MATYAIGDLQGCFQDLQQLLKKINYNPQQDFLWFTGDIINRGPQSLQCLRFVKQLVEENKAKVVLGNHELHFLAISNQITSSKPTDTFQEILSAPDFTELHQWVRTQPFIYYDTHTHYCLVHAGLAPQWNLAKAQTLAYELECTLRSTYYLQFLEHMYGNQPDIWNDSLRGVDRLRFICNCLTRIRFCSFEGKLDLKSKGSLGSQPPEYFPWFQIPWRYHQGSKIIFGHWAALYDNWDNLAETNIFPVDSGCVWGKKLTAMRLEDQIKFSVDCDCNTSPLYL